MTKTFLKLIFSSYTHIYISLIFLSQFVISANAVYLCLIPFQLFALKLLYAQVISNTKSLQDLEDHSFLRILFRYHSIAMRFWLKQ